MYQIGCGEAIKEREELLLNREVDLTARDGFPNVSSLPSVPEEVMEMVRVAPLDDFTWTGDPNGDLVRECAAMVREWAGSLQRQMHCSAYRLELGEHADRCEVAVGHGASLAISSCGGVPHGPLDQSSRTSQHRAAPSDSVEGAAAEATGVEVPRHLLAGLGASSDGV